MGLFDFFRRKKVQRQLEQMMSENQPRRQYYLFAHYVLRGAAFELGAACVGVLLSPKRDEFLREMWKHTSETVKENEPDQPLDPYPSIEAIPLKAGKFPCMVLRMPPPKGVTECYFVGIVAHVDLAAGKKPAKETPISYYTLERGVGDDLRTPRTVVCSWTKEGQHTNFGDGPPAEPEAFADAIAKVVVGEAEPHGAWRGPQ
jgi:hypothetical protein